MRLTIIIASGAAIASQVNTLLDSEHNLPRAGDRLTLTELTAPIYDTDSTRILDLSAAKGRKEINRRYVVTDDPHNQAVRDERRTGDFVTAPPHGSHRTVSGDNRGTDNHDTADNSGIDRTVDAVETTVEVWPTVVDDKTTVTLQLPAPAKVKVRLSDRAGAEMWTETRELATGTHSIDCPTAQLTAGPYILAVDTGKVIETRILIKR